MIINRNCSQFIFFIAIDVFTIIYQAYKHTLTLVVIKTGLFQNTKRNNKIGLTRNPQNEIIFLGSAL